MVEPGSEDRGDGTGELKDDRGGAKGGQVGTVDEVTVPVELSSELGSWDVDDDFLARRLNILWSVYNLPVSNAYMLVYEVSPAYPADFTRCWLDIMDKIFLEHF
jgi:hypothetical protein